ncbi:hypothetical protein [Dactylosporangium sp. NPDC048998]|uniref:aromatic-ring hydroxylase C-terminal domain-containing protein n=1 Tax=Dactylosporangium sp. NPDC048998 TaxID=3363976 RepID=UPI0037227068
MLDFTPNGGISPSSAPWADRVDVISAEPVSDYAAARLLVRPDGYVAFADPDGSDDEGLRAALTTWFGTP